MEIRKYIDIMLAYRVPLIIIPLVAALVALGATYAVSQKFEGVAVVQIIPDETEPRAITLRPNEGQGVVATGFRDPTELLTHGLQQHLGSRAVAQAIAEEMKLAERPEPTGWAAFRSWVRGKLEEAWVLARYGYLVQKSKDEAIVDLVERRIAVEQVRGSYYVYIIATWNDPLTAAEMANVAVDSVQNHMRAIANDSSAKERGFLGEQRLIAQQEVDEAREALKDYSIQNNQVRGQSVAAAVEALENARAAARQNELELSSVRRQVEVAQQQLDGTPPEVQAVSSVETASSNQSPNERTMTEVRTQANPVYQSLQQQVANQAQEVVRLETRQGQLDNEVLAEINLGLVDARQRLATVEFQLEEEERDMPDEVKENLKQESFNLRQQITSLEARRDEAITLQRSQTDRELAEARLSLAKAEEQLANTPAETTTEIVQILNDQASQVAQNSSQQTTSSPNPVYQSIQQGLLDLEQQSIALERKQSRLDADVQARQDELQDMIGRDAELASLYQELELATQVYSRRTLQWYDALLEESYPMEQIRLIDPAKVPDYPATPVKILWVGIGAAAGLALAVVLVFILYNTDLSIHSPDEAEAALNIPLLAVVPTRGNGKRSRSSDRKRRGDPPL